jgi:hypothetical protein
MPSRPGFMRTLSSRTHPEVILGNNHRQVLSLFHVNSSFLPIRSAESCDSFLPLLCPNTRDITARERMFTRVSRMLPRLTGMCTWFSSNPMKYYFTIIVKNGCVVIFDLYVSWIPHLEHWITVTGFSKRDSPHLTKHHGRRCHVLLDTALSSTCTSLSARCQLDFLNTVYVSVHQTWSHILRQDSYPFLFLQLFLLDTNATSMRVLLHDKQAKFWKSLLSMLTNIGGRYR